MRRPITEREKKIYERQGFYSKLGRTLKVMACDKKDRSAVLAAAVEKEFPNEDTLTYDQLYRRMASGIVKFIHAYEETDPAYRGCEEADLKRLQDSITKVLGGWATLDDEAVEIQHLFRVIGYTVGETTQDAFDTQWAVPVCPYDECHDEDEDEDEDEEGEDAV